MSIISKQRALLVAGALVAGCAEQAAPVPTADHAAHLDQLTPSDAPASLLVLGADADAASRLRLERTVEAIGGRVFATLPPRLVTAYLPDGAAPLLADLGVVARFDRATDRADLPDASIAEARFQAVHASRWFAGGDDDITPRRRLRAPGEGEAPARLRPELARLADPGADDSIAVPFASGTIAVSIVLPESTGAIDPSTEDWTEDMVRETYLKVTAALDRLAAAEPNAGLRFVVHLESAPAGGLDGTVATGYEFGQRAQWGSSTEFLATADVLAGILGRPVAEGEAWTAAVEYTTALKRRYDADGAFFVIVAANGNYTAGLRAHAYIHGPWTVLDTSYGHETFAHEFGHIFGALDEYCPDACIAPFAVAGYLGMYNANAQAQPGAGGIDDGRGEGVGSLMIYNDPGAINGYTRAAWGWLDVDGDGRIDVRDTAPASELTAEVDGQRVRLRGVAVDRPASRLGASPYSVNRIDALEYAFAADGPWFRLALTGGARGRAEIDVELGELPASVEQLHVRAVNSVGNVEPRPQVLAIAPRGAANTAPHLALTAPARAGADGLTTVVATVEDLEGDAVEVRFDLDGDGAWDTGFVAPGPHRFVAAAGLRAVRAEARDARGATRSVTVDVPVLTGAAAPTLELGPVPGVVHGVSPAALDVAVTATPGAALSARIALATNDDTVEVPVAIVDGRLHASLPTPSGLRTQPVDLSAGDRSLGRHDLRDVAALGGELIAVAAGAGGLWIVDVTEPTRPQVVATLALETTANRLLKVGRRLYVLGSYLAIVDLSDPRAPRELKQWWPAVDQTAATSDEVVAISDGDGGYAPHFLSTGLGGRIARTAVTVTIDHPRPADLRIVLRGAKGGLTEELVLWDHQPARGGRRTLWFTSANTAALRALDGELADGFWQLEVQDDVANRLAGTLLASRLEFTTRSFAARAGVEPAELAGVTSAGALIVAGREVAALDVTFAPWVATLSTLAATGVTTATLTGDTAIVAAALESKDADGAPSTAPVRGLCAIDFARPTWPRLIRCETALGPVVAHAQIAGRLYATVSTGCHKGDACDPPVTLVGSAARFARGWGWRQGATPYRVDRWAFGDVASVWTVNDVGSIDRLDVSDPAAIRLAERHTRTWTVRLVPLGDERVLLFDYGPQARLALLDDAWSITSRLYQLAVTATVDGQATTVTRAIHVIPYDHAPAAPIVAIEPPSEWASAGRVMVSATDPDDGTTWDPYRFARVDYDGDGAFDTDWQWMWPDRGGRYQTEFYPGADQVVGAAVVEVRDGFWAVASTRLGR